MRCYVRVYFFIWSVCDLLMQHREQQRTGWPYGFPHRFGRDDLVFGDLVLLPTSFSIGPIEVNGKTFLQLLQLYLLGGFVFKPLQDPESEELFNASYNY